MTERAVVTREHREAAYAARVLHTGVPRTWVIAWLDSGADNCQGDFGRQLNAIAQAIADAEARGAQSGAVRCASLQEEAVKQRLAAQNARAEVKQLRAELAGAIAALADDEQACFPKTVADLRAELSALRSQANEYGRHPGPIAPTPRADREGLEADVKTLRLVLGSIGCYECGGQYDRVELLKLLSRIAAALGLKERT